MSDQRDDKRGRGRGPNAVRGHEILQNARLDGLETGDAEQDAAIQQLKDDYLAVLDRLDAYENEGASGGEEPPVVTEPGSVPEGSGNVEGGSTEPVV